MKQDTPILMLIDAHALIHRAYHALPDMATKQGEPTGGLYGLLTMVLRAIGEYHPRYVVACYDMPGPTFRHTQFADYKGTRVKADDALRAQLQRSRDVFEALSIPIYSAPGFEADDMLGTIVEQIGEHEQLTVRIVTGDADTLQLVSGERIQVITLRKGLTDVVLYNETAVQERYGFGPLLLPDYKGLCGDASDNIPGVDGIGEKTATHLITTFGSLEHLYHTIETHEEKCVKEGVKPRIIQLLKDQKETALFSKMLATIRRDAPITFTLPEEWRKLADRERFVALCEVLEFRTLVKRFDALLTQEEKPSQSVLVGEVENVDPQVFRRAQIAFWLLDAEKGGVALSDMRDVLHRSSLEDMLHHLEEELRKQGLYTLYETIEIPLIPIVERIEQVGILLDEKHLARLSKEYHTQLSRLKQTIYTHAGEEFNINSPKQLGSILFEKLQLSAKGIKKTAGGGARSTKESELEKLRNAHPIIEPILEYREIQKVLTTYIDALPPLCDAQGRVHTKLHQDGTVTGRFSSSEPNLQNIPVRDGYGELIRDAFIASPGKILLALDYSQIELRVLAMLSRDPALCEIFERGEDIHTGVAARIFNIHPSQVGETERRKAKTINFGILYGMGVTALGQSLGISRDEAQAFHDQYFQAFPTIRAYLDRVLRDATVKGYTETLFGRRRPFPNLRSHIPFIRAMAERMAMNAPIQGTAADFVKKAMVDVVGVLSREKLDTDVTLLLQVHDELIFEVTDREDIVKSAERCIRQAMESVHKETSGKHVPLHVSIAKGKKWGSMSKIR
jgi:DNA polymerase I